MDEKYWGMEAVCDVAGCDILKVTDPAHIGDFARDLVQRLDMEAFGEPEVVHFGKDEKAGWTLIQLITTSNIIGHFNDVDGSAYLNVFSCKSFTPDIVEQAIRDWFDPDSIKTTFLIRNAHNS